MFGVVGWIHDQICDVVVKMVVDGGKAWMLYLSLCLLILTCLHHLHVALFQFLG